MFFLISYIVLLPSTFLFFLTSLTPNWLTFTKIEGSAEVVVQRGLFFICYVLASNKTHETSQCVSMIYQSSSTEPSRWIHGFALGAASMAIICIIFSFIVLFLSGIYLQLRRRIGESLWYLLAMCLLMFLILGCSSSVWLLLISETLGLGVGMTRRTYNWPMWITLVACIGYLVSFIAMFISFCILCRRDKKVEIRNPRNRVRP